MDCPILQDIKDQLQNLLNETLDQEELMWFQKSRHNWIVDGDKNIRFYHLKTVIRISQNRITRLRGSMNMWIEDPIEKDHLLVVPPSDLEIRQNLLSMGAYKFPRFDGYPTIFFQRHWNRWKIQVYSAIKTTWVNLDSIKEVKATLLVSFILDRQIQDNITIVQELIHSTSKMRGKKAFMTIKIDLVMAYDRCIFSTRTNVLWNGGKTKDFSPSRGLRQGDPLLRYHLVLAIEKLTHIITTAINGGLWKPMYAGKGGPRISHLAFADDLMMFMEATEDHIHMLLKCLKFSEETYGQKLSVEKTFVFFSKNTSREVMDKVVQISGFKRMNKMGRYLRAMTQQGRFSKSLYEGLVGKIKDKLSSWQQQCLSQASHITLSQLVLAAIPSFQMRSCKLPLGLSSGLGLRRLDLMNDAYLAKKAWRIHTNLDQLWVQVTHAKYRVHGIRDSSFEARKGYSNLWRNVCRIWHALEDILVCVLSNDVVTAVGEWDFDQIRRWLPINVIDIIRSILPPKLEDGPDKKSVSRIIELSDGENNCPCYNGMPETIIHVLRGCSSARLLWDKLRPLQQGNEFYNSDIGLASNFSSFFVEYASVNWLSTFLVTYWKIWCRRKKVKNGEEVPPLGLKVDLIRRLVLDADSAAGNLGRLHINTGLCYVNVSWNFLKVGFVKVNTDGAARSNLGRVACGGVIRDS
ncbi:uncharacterized protein LOC133286127 [Gastrolobium bilobum]|uniref:uncharacterized protein LOC133286127 n=1 Tax=Gastrolobium bilobum TaxID=150636 RepID=UPI002AB2A82C|nr:uncharacterized protein LOC133286127 [Gastrolobium bilobum]